MGATVVAASLSACSAAETPAPSAPPPPPPPPPPAACLLDTGALTATTGLVWAPDASTASDTRCVYDPSGTPRPADDGPAFLAVDVAQDPATTLDTVAELCEDGSRAPTGTTGFVCRYQGGNVFAAATHDGRLVTLAASAVPAGTTAAQLVVAFDQQVAALSR